MDSVKNSLEGIGPCHRYMVLLGGWIREPTGSKVMAMTQKIDTYKVLKTLQECFENLAE